MEDKESGRRTEELGRESLGAQLRLGRFFTRGGLGKAGMKSWRSGEAVIVAADASTKSTSSSLREKKKKENKLKERKKERSKQLTWTINCP